MAVVDIFSKRQKRMRGDAAPANRCDFIPKQLRVQLVHIVLGLLRVKVGSSYPPSRVAGELLEKVVMDLRCEYGLFVLTGDRPRSRRFDTELLNFIVHDQRPEHVLDAVEHTLRIVGSTLDRWSFTKRERRRIEEAIEEINERFRGHGVGYHYDRDRGEFVRVEPAPTPGPSGQ